MGQAEAAGEPAGDVLPGAAPSGEGLTSARRAAPGQPPARHSFAVLIWMHCINDGLAAYLPGVLPFLAAVRHIPLAAASALMTVLLFGQALQPLAGALADRIGGRALILLGPALSAAACVAISRAPSYAAVAAALFLTGLGNTVFHPQALTAARGLVGRRQGTHMSVFLVGGELGRALGPLVAGVIVARGGIGRLWLLALPVALSWPWIWRALPVQVPRPGAVRRIAWSTHLRPMLALVAFGGLRAAAIYSVSTFVPFLWRARGGSLVAGASLVTTLIGIGILGNLTGGAVSDRWGRRPVLYGSSLLAAAMLAVLPGARGLWLWPILALMGIALFSTAPVTMLVGQDVFAENPALGSGVALGLANGLGAFLLLPLGLISARWGIEAVLWVTLLLVLAAVPVIGVLRPQLGDHHRPAQPPVPEV